MAERTPDARILDYLRSGPETAPAAFVEETLRPIPRMRQRRPWQVRIEDALRPVRRPASIAIALVLLVAILVAVATLGGGDARPAPPSAPTFELTLSPTDPAGIIPDRGPYFTDPTATTNLCQPIAGGFWRIQYSGGDPYVRLDGFVGPAGAVDGMSEDVSFEIVIGSPLTTLLTFDQPGYRSGDFPGRSTATVETTVTPETIAFDVAATTPRRQIDFSDLPDTVDIDLRIVCPT